MDARRAVQGAWAGAVQRARPDVQGAVHVAVQALGWGALCRAWILRRLTLPGRLPELEARFPGRMPFRAFYNHDLQTIYVFAPFVPRVLRRSARNTAGSTAGLPASCSAGQLWLALHDHGTPGPLSTILRKDRELLVLHEGWFHGWAGRHDHEDRGIGAADLVTRYRSSTWDDIERAWAQLVTAGVSFNLAGVQRAA